MSKTVYAPHHVHANPLSPVANVFLAGSIEMGTADNWQPKVTAIIEKCDGTGLIYNPRRLDFQADALQVIENDYFREQVEWELEHICKADIVFMYFDPNSKSPVSLMELGYVAKMNKLIVCCPDGFWRKGNVEIMCTKEAIPFYDELEPALLFLKSRIAAISREKKRAIAE